MREHLGTHYKNKPFQCPYCLKFYKRKGVVKNHMLIHYQDASFLEKKDLYESIVDKLDNKNFLLLSDGKNSTTTFFSTKEESNNNSPNLPILRPNEKLMNELLLNDNKNNTRNESYEKKSKTDEIYKKEKESDAMSLGWYYQQYMAV